MYLPFLSYTKLRFSEHIVVVAVKASQTNSLKVHTKLPSNRPIDCSGTKQRDHGI